MAELVGLIASIAALIQLTNIGKGYIHSAKHAPKEIAKLQGELVALQGILQDLHQKPDLLAALKAPLRICTADIKELQSEIEPKPGIRRLLHRCRWPLKEKETLDSISMIERHKSLLTLALTADQHHLSMAIEAFSRNTNLLADEILRYVQTEFTAQKEKWYQEAVVQAGEKRLKVLTWLYPQDVYMKHTEISEKRQEHTGMWLTREPQFEGWIKENPDSQLLWCHGIPGAGKTYLSSLIIDRLQSSSVNTASAVAFIYFQYQEQDQQRPVHIWSSLVKQLASQNCPPVLPKELESFYDDKLEKQKRPTSAELQRILLTLLKLFSRVFFVFDALDECHEEKQRREILPFFHVLAENGASIFLTSRPYPQDIHLSLSVPSVRRVEILANEEDIRIYVREKIKANPHASALIPTDFRDEIVTSLVKHANGMFLLVHFYIEDLCKHVSMNQMRRALENLGTSLAADNPLHEMYNRVMDTIHAQHRSRKELAIKVLSWLVKARRTLTVDEIRTAVAVEQGQCELSPECLPNIEVLVEVCASLAIIDHKSNTIQLAHYSIQEYLVGNEALREAELEVTKACITFLSFNTFSQRCEFNFELGFRFSSNPLLSYAASQLSTHLRACDERLTTDMVLQFAKNRTASASYAQACYYLKFDYYSLPQETSPLHIVCRLGHCSAARQMIEDGANISFINGYEGTPLGVAAEEGHLAMVQLLHDLGAGINTATWDGSPLLLAAENGHEAVVRQLLEYGADIDIVGHTVYGYAAPLAAAAYNGHKGIVELLLRKGAEVDASAAKEVGDGVQPRYKQT